MPCKSIDVTQHAFARAVERRISLADAVEIARTGEIIASYPYDTPYPSRLMLGFNPFGQPLHIVVGESPDGICTIITVYRPEPDIWNADFKTRKPH